MRQLTKPFSATAQRRPVPLAFPWPWRRLFARPAVSTTPSPVPAASTGPWQAHGAFPFPAALAALGLRAETPAGTAARLPGNGPLIVLATQPFSLASCLALGAFLQPLRPDFKVWDGQRLGAWPGLDRYWLGDAGRLTGISARSPLRPMREALGWLRSGGVLVIPLPEERRRQPLLPPGTAARRQADRLLALLCRHTAAAVLPVHIPSRVTGKRREAETAARRPGPPRTIPLRIGSLLSPQRLAGLTAGPALVRHLRLRAYLLQDGRKSAPPAGTGAFGWRPVRHMTVPVPTAPLPGDAGQRELGGLPPEQRLVACNDTDVWLADARQIPLLLQEIGRLRELTFRQTGEGTGRERDLDRHDFHYLHLLAWNRERRELIGAYRVGRIVHILRQGGPDGLYLNSLFRFRRSDLEALGPALELGRSFVRPEYQRSFSPLLCLWRGIGQLVVRQPQYRCLLGPVSMSAHYRPASRQLLAAFLQARHALPTAGGIAVRPRHPFRMQAWGGVMPPLGTTEFQDLEEVSQVIAAMEADGKGVPILIRQYLRMGGRMLGFNLDPKFSNALDGLVMVDLMQTPLPLLEKYLGRDGAALFRRHHQGHPPASGHELPADQPGAQTP